MPFATFTATFSESSSSTDFLILHSFSAVEYFAVSLFLFHSAPILSSSLPESNHPCKYARDVAFDS